MLQGVLSSLTFSLIIKPSVASFTSGERESVLDRRRGEKRSFHPTLGGLGDRWAVVHETNVPKEVDLAKSICDLCVTPLGHQLYATQQPCRIRFEQGWSISGNLDLRHVLTHNALSLFGTRLPQRLLQILNGLGLTSDRRKDENRFNGCQSVLRESYGCKRRQLRDLQP